MFLIKYILLTISFLVVQNQDQHLDKQTIDSLSINDPQKAICPLRNAKVVRKKYIPVLHTPTQFNKIITCGDDFNVYAPVTGKVTRVYRDNSYQSVHLSAGKVVYYLSYITDIEVVEGQEVTQGDVLAKADLFESNRLIFCTVKVEKERQDIFDYLDCRCEQ